MRKHNKRQWLSSSTSTEGPKQPKKKEEASDQLPIAKRPKLDGCGRDEKTLASSLPVPEAPAAAAAAEAPSGRPKSKKELRKERKAAAAAARQNGKKEDTTRITGKEDDSGEPKKKGHKKNSIPLDQQRGLERKSKKEERERKLEERFREQDRLRQEKLHTTTTTAAAATTTTTNSPKKDNKKKGKSQQEQQSGDTDHVDDYAVYKTLFKKTADPTTGMTACRMGVQYKDIKLGLSDGPVVRSKSLVTVKYQLRGGSFHGVVLDSSKKFTFRVGKGEVIAGWDIGVEGMRVGGVRHLVVPPKAGYGSQDIGAGPGALLFFDITLLQVVR